MERRKPNTRGSRTQATNARGSGSDPPYLVNRKKRRDFTEEEDTTIVSCHKKFGCRWAKMR
jgi:hypothetical protein